MRDLRDPKAMGEALLRMADVYRRAQPGMTLADVAEYGQGTLEDHVPDYPGDESPLERYGDPRLYHVEVQTTIRRVPVAVGPCMGARDERCHPEPGMCACFDTKPIERVAEPRLLHGACHDCPGCSNPACPCVACKGRCALG